MSRKRQTALSSHMSEPDDEYVNKRKRNNEAVLKSRMKSRQKEQLTMERVDELKEENCELERKVEVLNRELAFLKDMFVAYAAGNKKKAEASSSSNQSDLDDLLPSTASGRREQIKSKTKTKTKTTSHAPKKKGKK